MAPEWITNLGYEKPRQLGTIWLALQRSTYTIDLCVVLSNQKCAARYRYLNYGRALTEYLIWTGLKRPGGWMVAREREHPHDKPRSAA